MPVSKPPNGACNFLFFFFTLRYFQDFIALRIGYLLGLLSEEFTRRKKSNPKEISNYF